MNRHERRVAAKRQKNGKVPSQRIGVYRPEVSEENRLWMLANVHTGPQCLSHPLLSLGSGPGQKARQAIMLHLLTRLDTRTWTVDLQSYEALAAAMGLKVDAVLKACHDMEMAGTMLLREDSGRLLATMLPADLDAARKSNATLHKGHAPNPERYEDLLPLPPAAVEAQEIWRQRHKVLAETA